MTRNNLARPAATRELECPVPVAAPWTQNIRITWRPELRFYERRIDLLRELEDLGHLRAFRVTDTGVEARLFDSMHILAVRSNGVMLRFLGPEESHTADAWDTLTRAIAAMEPQSIIEMSAAYQHLAPLTMTFEEALAQSYKTFLTQPGGELVLGDWAMLVDVDKVGDVPANGQIEFGIVRAREVPDRLSHRAGRPGRVEHSRRPRCSPSRPCALGARRARGSLRVRGLSFIVHASSPLTRSLRSMTSLTGFNRRFFLTKRKQKGERDR